LIDETTTLTATELGRVLGLTARRVRQLHEEGQFERSERGQYPLAACVQAYVAAIEAQSDPEELKRERIALLKAQRRRIEQAIRDREAAGKDLDWQDAMIKAITFECQMRLRMIATWLHTEFEARDVTMADSRDAIKELTHAVAGWAGGIRREMEADFLAAAERARRKQVFLDSWEKVVAMANGREVEGDADAENA
jgi:hypothetical protein